MRAAQGERNEAQISRSDHNDGMARPRIAWAISGHATAKTSANSGLSLARDQPIFRDAAAPGSDDARSPRVLGLSPGPFSAGNGGSSHREKIRSPTRW